MSATGDELLDIAVIGDGAALVGVADALATDAAGLRWSVFSSDPALDAVVPGENLDARQVTSALSMGGHIALLVGADMVSARTVIVAASVPPAIAGERALRGRGVSYCAECDGALARGRRVAAFVDTPALAHELTHLTGSARLDVIGASPDITPHYREGIAAVDGAGHVEHVRLEDGTVLDVDFLFLLTDRVPAPVLVPGVAVDADDRIVVEASGRTSIRGVFATGPIAVGSDAATAPPPAVAVATAVQLLTSPPVNDVRGASPDDERK